VVASNNDWLQVATSRQQQGAVSDNELWQVAAGGNSWQQMTMSGSKQWKQ